jgi:hypothetical protein
MNLARVATDLNFDESGVRATRRIVSTTQAVATMRFCAVLWDQ